jgi:hypothetical protein
MILRITAESSTIRIFWFAQRSAPDGVSGCKFNGKGKVKDALLNSRRPLQKPRQRRPAEAGRYKFNGWCKSNVTSTIKDNYKDTFKGKGAPARLPACGEQAYATRRLGLVHGVYRRDGGET